MPFDPERLLQVEALPALLERTPAPCIIDVGSPDRYLRAHLPGAVLVTPMELVDGTPPAAGRLPELDRLQALAERLDLTPDRELVIYDDEGGGWAGRMAWTLDVLGHDRWRYLDGGLHAWQAAGLPLDRVPAAPPQRTGAGAPVPVSLDRAPIAELEDVLAAIDDPRTSIWDARSAEEYRGERRTALRNGHIPGARHLDWLELVDPARAMRLRTDADTLIRARGIDLEGPVITHCHSHHRSGLTYLVARLLGARHLRAYHGSWSEWGNRDDVPVATGAAP
ncbi:MAG: sulfurtransferase [Pseudomonadales bacterium]|jgi:thiosulfate/3-mercaptopyruvate sulfurtransferase|nr:sulfurtransferase [Pseudomonadales bacterium]